MDIIKEYQLINSKFKKTLVFNFGSSAGFYSEFNNMVFGIIYCLKHGIKFIMFSNEATFKITSGWEDFFLPFCDETRSSFHKILNKRGKPLFLSAKEKVLYKIFKTINPNTFFTYEIFDKFFNENFEKETFNFKNLGIEGDLRSAARTIVDMIYRFNESTKTEIYQVIDKLKLPNRYVSLHIRRGDKNTEWNYVELSTYVNKLKELSSDRHVFVATDDYNVVKDLRIAYPEYNFYTLSDETDKGFVYGQYEKVTSIDKRRDFIKLFATVEIVCSSMVAVGAFTSNLGLFFGMRMPYEKFYSVQKQSWFQFDVDDVINDRQINNKLIMGL